MIPKVNRHTELGGVSRGEFNSGQAAAQLFKPINSSIANDAIKCTTGGTRRIDCE